MRGNPIIQYNVTKDRMHKTAFNDERVIQILKLKMRKRNTLYRDKYNNGAYMAVVPH
jgi:hypothetical protein